MRTLLKFTFTVCLSITFFSNCNKENALSDLKTGADIKNVESLQALTTQSADRYILMGTNISSQTTKVRQKIKELSATETGIISKLNMMFVTSANASFKSAMTALGLTVVTDRAVRKPAVQFQSNSEAAPNAHPGSTNPYFPILWGMQAISAPQAWAAGYKGAGVRVAVLDEGFYLNHPDIGPNINKTISRNFVEFPGENVPTDPSFKSIGFSHGTHVAGTIAALDNNIGVVGVAPKAEIMAVKVLSDIEGYGLFSWIANGIVYAADNGADVINMSLGGLVPKGLAQDANELQLELKPVRDAILYAKSKGTTVISAAGNDGVNFDHTGSWENYPSALPGSLCISATSPYNFYSSWIQGLTTNLDIPTSYTNYGASRIDFAAPGGDFDAFGTSSSWYFDMVLSTSGPSDYYFAAGTSMATPHASGVAALIIGKNGGSMEPAKVIAKLRSSSDDLGKVGNDPYFGGGRVNAFKAIK